MSHKEPAAKKPKNTLCNIKNGLSVRVKELLGEPSMCHRLRELGFCEYAEVCKVAAGEALICHVCGVRVILSKRLAENIVVEAVDYTLPKSDKTQ